MSLNCRSGDLAIVVAGEAALERELIGTLLHVTELEAGWGEANWCYAGPRKFVRGVELISVPDRCLRPIRDPGDDAQDESFRWAPAPEKVAA